MEILKRVAVKSLIVILPAAAASAFIDWKRLPVSIITGGIFGILNLRAIVRNVEGHIGSDKAAVKMMFMSMVRIFILFSAIFLLIWLKIVNIMWLLAGFTVVLVFIIVEGVKAGRAA